MLLQFVHDGEPTLSVVAAAHGLALDALDAAYGVVLVDPDAALWVVRVVDDAAAVAVADRLGEDDRAAGAGVFVDARVDPVDPGGGAAPV